MDKIFKDIKIGDKTVTIEELTMAGVRKLWKSVTEAVETGVIEHLDFELFPGADLLTIKGMVGDLDLEGLTPTQVKAVVEVCRSVNPDFFALRDRIVKVSRAA